MTCACARARAGRERRAATALGRALLARERGERQARAEALQVDVPAASRSWVSGAALGDRRSPSARRRPRHAGGQRASRAQRRRPAAHRARRTGHALSASPYPTYPDFCRVRYPRARSHAIEHVVAQPVARREAWVVEVVGRVVRHPDAPHDRLRAHVLRVVNETSSLERRVVEGVARRSRAPPPSRSPAPSARRARRQPISTQGVKCASKAGTTRPTKPMNGATPGTSTAQGPKPWSREVQLASAARARRSARAAGAPAMCSITRGSALRAANGSRSSARHSRSSRRRSAGDRRAHGAATRSSGCPLRTASPTATRELAHDAGAVRADLVLHLHRLDDHEHLARLDGSPSPTSTRSTVPCIGLATSSPPGPRPCAARARSARRRRSAASSSSAGSATATS